MVTNVPLSYDADSLKRDVSKLLHATVYIVDDTMQRQNGTVRQAASGVAKLCCHTCRADMHLSRQPLARHDLHVQANLVTMSKQGASV